MGFKELLYGPKDILSFSSQSAYVCSVKNNEGCNVAQIRTWHHYNRIMRSDELLISNSNEKIRVSIVRIQLKLNFKFHSNKSKCSLNAI